MPASSLHVVRGLIDAQPSNGRRGADAQSLADAEAPPPARGQRQLEHVVDGDHADDPLLLVDAPAASRGCSRSSCARPPGGRRRSRPTPARARRAPPARASGSARSSVTTNTDPVRRPRRRAGRPSSSVPGARSLARTRSIALRDVSRRREADEVRAHQAARGRGVVAEQRLDPPALRRRQQREDPRCGGPGRSRRSGRPRRRGAMRAITAATCASGRSRMNSSW